MSKNSQNRIENNSISISESNLKKSFHGDLTPKTTFSHQQIHTGLENNFFNSPRSQLFTTTRTRKSDIQSGSNTIAIPNNPAVVQFFFFFFCNNKDITMKESESEKWTQRWDFCHWPISFYSFFSGSSWWGRWYTLHYAHMGITHLWRAKMHLTLKCGGNVSHKIWRSKNY